MHAPLNFRAMVGSTAVDENYSLNPDSLTLWVRKHFGRGEVQAGCQRELGRGQGRPTRLHDGDGNESKGRGPSARLSVPVVRAPAMGVM